MEKSIPIPVSTGSLYPLPTLESIHHLSGLGIQDILEQAQPSDIVLALENIQDWHDEIFFNAPQNMTRFLADMAHPYLKCTFDLMHA